VALRISARTVLSAMSTQDSLHIPTYATVVPSPACEPNNLPPGFPIERLHRFSVDQYHRMAEAGVFHPEERVELIEGVIVEMAPIGLAHRFAVDQLTRLLGPMVASDWYVAVQNPVSFASSEPQPDIAVIRGAPADYRNRHPGPNDVGLLIEVADSSLDFDRRGKGFMYSRYNVPEYWIVNVVEDCVERHRRSPGQTAFGPCDVFSLHQSVPVELDGKQYGEIKVIDLIANPQRG
jgi:Uma2 family endonuclease